MINLNTYINEKLKIRGSSYKNEIIDDFLGDLATPKVVDFCDNWAEENNVKNCHIVCYKKVSYDRFSEKITNYYDIEVCKTDRQWEKEYPMQMNGGPGPDKEIDFGEGNIGTTKYCLVIEFYDHQYGLMIKKFFNWED